MSVLENELATRSLVSRFTPDMVRELGISQRVCVRPLMRRVLDRASGTDTRVALPCGSTREAICPPCAYKARVLRMQQCTEGWHRTDEPDRGPVGELDAADPGPDDDQGDDDDGDDEGDSGRRVKSTRRRDDAGDLPRLPVDPRTVGQVFIGRDGHEYRPSMFLTLTLPSYGRIRPGGHGAPVAPGSYDYRRAALDALHFPKLLDRFWQNLRRAAGYSVQYFAAVEPQARLAPHLHAALRGAIPRDTLQRVIRGTYAQVWWPPHDHAVFDEDVTDPATGRPGGLPVWTGAGYADPTTGVMLPTWEEALDAVAADPDARPAHVLRFGAQHDIRGIVAPSVEADRAVRYLTKYLTKAIADPLTPTAVGADGVEEVGFDLAREIHINRLHEELRFLPCAPRCANWLRYGVQPENAGPGARPGWCPFKAHDREHLGLGGHRVMVSRQWSGKTLARHKADRATVVREALLAAGILAPETERLAADTLHDDGLPRFVWTDTRPDPATYVRVILESIGERQRWHQQYELAETITGLRGHHGPDGGVKSDSATDQPP